MFDDANAKDNQASYQEFASPSVVVHSVNDSNSEQCMTEIVSPFRNLASPVKEWSINPVKVPRKLEEEEQPVERALGNAFNEVHDEDNEPSF